MLWHHYARVNSHQRWKQKRFHVCFHLWCELTSKMNETEWQVSWNSCYMSFWEKNIKTSWDIGSIRYPIAVNLTLGWLYRQFILVHFGKNLHLISERSVGFEDEIRFEAARNAEGLATGKTEKKKKNTYEQCDYVKVIIGAAWRYIG